MINVQPVAPEKIYNGPMYLEDTETPVDGTRLITPANVQLVTPTTMTTLFHTFDGSENNMDKKPLTGWKNSMPPQGVLSSISEITEKFPNRWNDAHETQDKGWVVLSEEDYLKILLGF